MIGKIISHYKIIGGLGKGGMGEVYLAEDLRLERRVAIKFLPQYLTKDKENIERFEREAKAAASLNHPNIITIHEISELENSSETIGQIFIVMEYIDGESLRNRIDRGILNLAETIDITRQICYGLQEAHKTEIVHRDIKPENIIIDKSGRVIILDFGLAKLKGVSKLTKQASTLGTIQYASPEQLRGDNVDHRTDIWSLGVILYEMATGQLPFKGEYEQAVVYSILNELPGQINDTGSELASEFERVIERCIEKNISARYQNVSALLSGLDEISQSKLDSKTDFKQQKLEGTFSGFNSTWFWIAGSIIIAALVTMIIVKIFLPSEENKVLNKKMIVLLPFENMGPPEDEYFADGITEEITSKLIVLRELGVISRTSALSYKGTDKPIDQIAVELNVDFILEGTVRWQSGDDSKSRVRITPKLIKVKDNTQIWSETYDRLFENIFDIQTDIAERIVENLDLTFSKSEKNAIYFRPTENLVAYQIYLRGLDYLKYSHSTEDRYRSAQKIFLQAIKLDPNFALAYVKLSDVHRSLYFFGYDHTTERLEKAKEAVDRAFQLKHDLPAVHTALGYYYYQGQLDYDKALNEFSIAARGLPNDIELLANIGFVWRRQGLFDEAIINLEKALKLSPNDASLMAELAQSYLFIREYEKAIQYCNQCIDIAPDNKWAYLIKTLCYWYWLGNLNDARAVLESMPDKESPYSILFLYLQDIYERDYQSAFDRLEILSKETIEVQSAYLPKNLLEAWTFALLKDSLQAESSYENAINLLEEANAKEPYDPRVYSSLGLAYANIGLYEKAISAGERAVELYPVSKDALLGTNRIMDLISIYVITGNYDKAINQIIYLLSIPSSYSIYSFLINPRMDPLRELPRFQKLIKKYKEQDDNR